MRTIAIFATATAIAGAATYAAYANDSSAQLAGGGLILTKNESVRMASEDLYISPHEVRVRYEFVNDSNRDIETMVAFPMPKADMYELSEVPLGMTTGDPVNFIGFEVRENGRPIPVRLKSRALQNGRDVSDRVRAAGLPIGIYSASFNASLANLPAARVRALVRAGLMEEDGDSRRPKWTVELTYHWQQRFPAGRTITIEHRYKPVTGQQFFGRYSMTGEEMAKYWNKTFCIDPGTRAALGRALDTVQRGHGANEGSALLAAYSTAYILTTANNWKGPIGRFHLTVDKVKPQNIVSFCWNGGLRRTGPTRFESTVVNFRPRHDLNIAVFERPQQ